MNIDVEQFGLYLVVVVDGIALLWAVWPAVWPRKKKEEEIALDPVSEPAPVAAVNVDPIPEPIKEETPAVVETPTPVKKAAKKKAAAPAKKPAAKAPAAPAKKAPAKKTTKK